MHEVCRDLSECICSKITEGLMPLVFVTCEAVGH